MFIIDVITLFPKTFKNALTQSILGDAIKKGILKVRLCNLRSFGEGKHKTVDDTPFGGGPGMVLKVQPIYDAICFLKKSRPITYVMGLSPQGIQFTQDIASIIYKNCKRLTLVCGRYEGFDDRLRKEFDLELSVGDYVLSGGEYPAMVVIDVISRLLPGTIGDPNSVIQDSFYNILLDHAQFTRPAIWNNQKVPSSLLSGNHKEIISWRKANSILNTAILRPDLLKKLVFTNEDKKVFIENLGKPYNK